MTKNKQHKEVFLEMTKNKQHKEVFLGDLIFYKNHLSSLDSDEKIAFCYEKTDKFVSVFWFEDGGTTVWNLVNQDAVCNSAYVWSIVRVD